MPSSRQYSRIDTLELKAQIVRKLGRQAAEKYFNLLNRLFSLKLGKSEFDKLCIRTIGRENLSLHNLLIRSILKNACLAKTPPSKASKVEGTLNVKVASGNQRSNLQSLCGDVFPPSPRKGRSSNLRDRKSRDRPSPLGPHGKIQSTTYDELGPRAQEQQSATELFSLGSRPPGEVISVEDGEEVEQMAGSPSVQSRSPVKPPFGIPMNMGGARNVLFTRTLSAFHLETCHNSCELPDTRSLKSRLERKLKMEGLGISLDGTNLLNIGLDAFLKRLIKPCMELAASGCGSENLKQIHGERRMQRSVSASLLDFRVAMELDPQLLGVNWPIQLEKVCLRASDERA